MATCAQCGTISREGASFCGGCGAPLGKAGTIPGSPLDAAVEPPPPVRTAPSSAPPAQPAAQPAVEAPGALAEGTVIDGKYAVARVLGQGGMGIVYLARDIHTGLDVVVKAVRREIAHRSDVRQRTLAEGRALARIDHPNVVHLKAVVVEAQSLWLVMQYIDGESLEEIISRYVARGERMPVAEALAIFRQIVAGIGAAHQEGVIHRDLKPANVLVRTKDRVAKVTDFGIAKIPSDADRPQTRGIIGSLWYMSPEQVTGRRDLDQRVDIYALGILLYEMLTGRVPFDAESDYDIMRMHAEAPMPRVSAARPDVPAAVDELIQKACAKDRAHRFQSCEELTSALDRLASPAPPTRTMPDPSGATMPAPRAPLAQAHQAHQAHQGPAGGPAPFHAATTGHGAALPPPPPPRAAQRRKGWLLYAGALAVAAGLAAVIGLSALGGREPHAASPAQSDEKPPQDVQPSATPTAPPTAHAKSPLEALTGAWVANGKDLDAVLIGDVLEFRVRTPSQFDPQNYAAGEARFALGVEPALGPNVFSVEDRIRPLPPPGKAYDPRSRNTCQEAWTTAGGEPLQARFDGERLTVELAKIEPAGRNFIVEGEHVTGCKALSDLKAARVVNTLTRP